MNSIGNELDLNVIKTENHAEETFKQKASNNTSNYKINVNNVEDSNVINDQALKELSKNMLFPNGNANPNKSNSNINLKIKDFIKESKQKLEKMNLTSIDNTNVSELNTTANSFKKHCRAKTNEKSLPEIKNEDNQNEMKKENHREKLDTSIEVKRDVSKTPTRSKDKYKTEQNNNKRKKVSVSPDKITKKANIVVN